MRNSYYVDTISMYDILTRNAPERCPAVDVVHRYFRVDRLTSPSYVHGLDRGILDIKRNSDTTSTIRYKQNDCVDGSIYQHISVEEDTFLYTACSHASL